jgi:hypothetical protein
MEGMAVCLAAFGLVDCHAFRSDAIKLLSRPLLASVATLYRCGRLSASAAVDIAHCFGHTVRLSLPEIIVVLLPTFWAMHGYKTIQLALTNCMQFCTNQNENRISKKSANNEVYKFDRYL